MKPFLLFFVLLLLQIAVADVSQQIPVAQQHGNCGTVQNKFKMGQLLHNDTDCHGLRWGAMSYTLEKGCACEFYRSGLPLIEAETEGMYSLTPATGTEIANRSFSQLRVQGARRLIMRWAFYVETTESGEVKDQKSYQSEIAPG
jgi:hypothetical protein